VKGKKLCHDQHRSHRSLHGTVLIKEKANLYVDSLF